MIKPIQNINFNGRKRVLSREDIRVIPASNPTDLEKSVESRLQVQPTSTVIKKFANGETY